MNEVPTKTPRHLDMGGVKTRVVNMRYQDYDVRIANQPDLLKELPTLRGKKLGCWCSPDSCHGDVLVEIIDKDLPIEDGWEVEEFL